jgi:hypothetical protein
MTYLNANPSLSLTHLQALHQTCLNLISKQKDVLSLNPYLQSLQVGQPTYMRAIYTHSQCLYPIRSPSHWGWIDVAANVKNTNANHIFIANTGDPHSYHDALCTPHSKEWEKALGIWSAYENWNLWVAKECTTWLKNNRQQNCLPWKRDGKGTVYQWKCHIVAKGYL